MLLILQQEIKKFCQKRVSRDKKNTNSKIYLILKVDSGVNNRVEIIPVAEEESEGRKKLCIVATQCRDTRIRERARLVCKFLALNDSRVWAALQLHQAHGLGESK